MKVLSIMFLLLLGSYSVASQIMIRTELVSAMPVVVNGKLVKPKGKSFICFPENGRACELQPGRLPDITYGALGTKEEPDWFVVTGTYPIRTKMINIGPHSWQDNNNWRDDAGILPIEPYPELKPGESRKTLVKFVADESVVVSSLIAVAEASGERAYLRPGKIVETSSDILKVLEGYMYLLYVRDNIYGYRVLLRVDKVNPGKSISVSWKALLPQ